VIEEHCHLINKLLSIGSYDLAIADKFGEMVGPFSDPLGFGFFLD